jgi:DNA-binding CsgD family transcriptional regulator
MDITPLKDAFKKGGYKALHEELDNTTSHQLSIAEISEVLGMKRDNVKALLKSAFFKLKNPKTKELISEYRFD